MNKTHNKNLIEKKYAHLPIITAIYCGFLILSNLTGSKISEIGSFSFSAAIIFFPMTYVIDDIVTEVYGFRASRIMIWSGLFVNFIMVIGLFVIVHLPASNHWENQKAFEQVFLVSGRIFSASLCAYFVGEFVNSYILAKMKIIYKGAFFWKRAILSTIIGAAFDTVIFSFIAFYQIMTTDVIWTIIFSEYQFKILFEICVLPITYLIVQYLKKHDNIDYYDEGTYFSPFSLKLDD